MQMIPGKQIKLYQTSPHPCSYLSNEQAVTAFVDPETIISSGTYEKLSSLGFRRSGSYLYKPVCEACNACVPVRIPTATFAPSKSQKRCIKRNRDISVEPKKYIDLEQHYPLYAQYINLRHADGDMYPPSESQFSEFINDKREETQFLEFRQSGRLIGCAVTDVLRRSLSAIYTYFDPLFCDRSLGKFAILYQIDLAQRKGLDHVYLGYWIKQSQKMNYKADYRPMETFDKNIWNLVE